MYSRRSINELVLESVWGQEIFEVHELEFVVVLGGFCGNGRGWSGIVMMGWGELLLSLGASVLLRRSIMRGSSWFVLLFSADSIEPGRALETGESVR